MRNRNRSNVLLVEILIAVLFFMLSATVLVRVFVTSRNLTVRSGVEAKALVEAQNVAEALYAAGDPEELLAEMEFGSSHGAWSKDYGDFSIYVTGEMKQSGVGLLWDGAVSAFYKVRLPDAKRAEDEELFTLPCVRYEGVRS